MGGRELLHFFCLCFSVCQITEPRPRSLGLGTQKDGWSLREEEKEGRKEGRNLFAEAIHRHFTFTPSLSLSLSLFSCLSLSHSLSLSLTLSPPFSFSSLISHSSTSLSSSLSLSFSPNNTHTLSFTPPLLSLSHSLSIQGCWYTPATNSWL